MNRTFRRMNLIAIKQFERKLRKIQCDFQKELGISHNCILLLELLYEYDSPISVKQAAEELCVCSQAITRMVHQLKALRFIHVEKSSHDRRVTYLYLTQEGKQLVNQMLTAQEKAFEIEPTRKISTPIFASENGYLL